MRKFALLLAALALPTALAAQQRQTTPPPAAPPLELSEAQRATLTAAVERGRILAQLDRASQVSTRDMLLRVSDPEGAGIAGWVGIPEGNGVSVIYYARDGETFRTVYRGQVLGARVSEPQVLTGDERTPLEGVAARMAAARHAVDALNHRPCTGTAFNSFVVPPADPDGPITVYEINPRTAADRIPAGGHFRTVVNPDGSVGDSVRIGGECADLPLPAVPEGERPQPLVLDDRGAELPNELPVFVSLWTGRPVVVATGVDQVRLWGVTGQGIGELRQ